MTSFLRFSRQLRVLLQQHLPVGVLVEDSGAVYEVAQEAVCETAAEHFLIAS
jgi:hypothetical protein